MLDFGSIIADKYCLEAPIGEGGFGTIWRANQMDLDRPVAIKVLRPSRGETKELLDKTLTEARVAAAVQHRNVVSILDVGQIEGGVPFIVMEYLEGESLADRLARKPMSVADILRVADGALRGLAAVHAAGIVHRDIKLENLFLVYDPDGWFPKLLDFGISKTDPTTITDLRQMDGTARGRAIGTPQYMSPEQARGKLDIDLRSDLFSLAVVLYEALTGHLPFDAPDPLDVLVAVTRDKPPTLAHLRPDLPNALSDALEKAMEKKPDRRFADAREMRLALSAAFDDVDDGREPTGRIRRAAGGSMETRERPMSTPPPAGMEDFSLPMGAVREREEAPTDEAPIRGATMLVDRKPGTARRRRLVIGTIAAVAAVLLLAGAARLFVGGDDPSDRAATTNPSAPAPAERSPVPDPPPIVAPSPPTVDPEPEPAPEPPSVVEAAPTPTPSRAARSRPAPTRRARAASPSPRRRGRVFESPDF